MKNQRHPTDMREKQWGLIEPLLPATKPGGRSHTLDMRLAEI